MFAALNVEHVEQVFHADVVRGERGWIVARKLRSSAGDGSDGIAVVGGIDDDMKE